MADYSGDRDQCTVYFRPDGNPFYWGSVKNFKSATRVPKEYLGLLQDLFRDFVNRNKDYYWKEWSKTGYPTAHIRFDGKTEEWVLDGYELFWCDDETKEYLERNK